MKDQPMTYITQDEAEAYINMLELYFIPSLREDDDVDNLDWLAHIMRVYDRMSALVKADVTPNMPGCPQTPCKYKDAIERMGSFGQLFVDYKGCPRGRTGRACTPLIDEVLSMPVITDVDGQDWRPVTVEALDELIASYKNLMAQILNREVTNEQG